MENNNQINTLNVYDNNQKIYKNAKRSFFVMLGQIIAISSFIFIFLVSFLAIVYTAVRGSYNSDIYALLVLRCKTASGLTLLTKGAADDHWPSTPI